MESSEPKKAVVQQESLEFMSHEATEMARHVRRAVGETRGEGLTTGAPHGSPRLWLGIGTKSTLTQLADSKHFLIATDFCTYGIRVHRVRIFYLI
jgi:hypothetical protein